MERQEQTPHVPLIVVRVQAATDDLDRFIAGYCRYFGSDILFLPTEGVQPPGRRVRFVFALAGGRDLVCGEGVVMRMRHDSGNPDKPPGMELRYEVLDEQSQQIVDRMLALRTGRPRPRPPEPPPYVSMSLSLSLSGAAAIAPLEPGRPAQPDRVLPANPLAEVPERALGFFVDEAFERITSHGPRGWLTASVFAVGLALGVGVMVALPAPRMEVVKPRRLIAPVFLPPGLQPSPSPAAAPLPLPSVAVQQKSPAWLELHSSPPGARVSVDGEPQGHTPVTLEVTRGAHTVLLERPRYAIARLELEAPARVTVPLERPPATLRVTSTPPGAEVRLHGHTVGQTPLELPTAGYRTYLVEVSREGHTRHRHVYLKPPASTVDVSFFSR